MRIFMMLILSLFTTISSAEREVFISFSMPDKLLIETLRESAELQIPAVLNGLIDNSCAKTTQKIMELTKEVPELQLQIDPTAFERFKIQQVPALVMSQGNCFDVIYGNLTLREGLERIHQKGECSKRGAS